MRYLDKTGLTALWKKMKAEFGGAFADVAAGGLACVSKAVNGTQLQGVSVGFTLYDIDGNPRYVEIKGDISFSPASATVSGMLSPADFMKLSELSRPSAGTLALNKLRTKYLAFAPDGKNEVGGLYIEDEHTMVQAKQGTPIKLGWRGGAAGFGMNLNGQVGLGYTTDGSLPTIDPTARLTVDGDLRVLGKVVADTPTPATATKIENGTDLNTLTEPGWYYFDGTSADKETLVHTPPSLSFPKFLMLVTPSSRPGTTYENGFKCSIILPFHAITTIIVKYFYFRRSMTGKWSKVDLSSIATTEEWEA